MKRSKHIRIVWSQLGEAESVSHESVSHFKQAKDARLTQINHFGNLNPDSQGINPDLEGDNG